MIAERTGSLAGLKRHDYLPFGEEIAANIGARNVPHNAFGYVDDSNRMQFTGHERDEETGLDYMQARHYGSAQGRFVSVDTVGGRGTDPQTLNLYAYVNNNPLRYTDPTGHSLADIGVLQTDNEYVARETERRVTAGWTRAMELGRFMSLLDKKLGTLGSGTSSRGPVAGATSQRVAEAQNKFKPLAETEVEIVDFKPPPDQEGYRLVRDGFTPVAFNGEPVLDEDGKVVSVNGVTFNKEYGFGIQLRYRLSFGRDFPKPDPNTSIMLEEVVTGTLDGEKSEPFTRKIHVRSKDNVFYADDFIGLTSNKPSGPTQVRESTQILTLSATIGGVAQSFTIRVNKITIDPRAEVKIRVVEQPPSQ